MAWQAAVREERPCPVQPTRQHHPHNRTETIMTKVLVLYYSAYGHIETCANAVAQVSRREGATVDITR